MSTKTIHSTHLRQWLSMDPLRLGESALLQGTPFFGIVFGLDNWLHHYELVLMTLAGSFLITNGIFILNDITDLKHDTLSKSQINRSSYLAKIGVRKLIAIVSFNCVVGLLLIVIANYVSAWYACGILLAGMTYSLEPFRSKEIPIASSLTHLIGGLLHFLVGFSLGDGPVVNGILIGIFFGGIFMAGHFIQEIRDYETDIASGITTNAVYFGRQKTFYTSLILFLLFPIYAALLAYTGIPPTSLKMALISIPLVLISAQLLLRDGLSRSGIMKFQKAYRITFAALGAYWVAVLT